MKRRSVLPKSQRAGISTADQISEIRGVRRSLLSLKSHITIARKIGWCCCLVAVYTCMEVFRRGPLSSAPIYGRGGSYSVSDSAHSSPSPGSAIGYFLHPALDGEYRGTACFNPAPVLSVSSAFRPVPDNSRLAAACLTTSAFSIAMV